MFKKILIANRGEIAVRIIRTCRDMGIQTVALYEESDRGSLHVRLADECVQLQSSSGFFDQAAILEIAQTTGAEAIHPGYGFLTERPDFITACTAAGIAFVGPPVDVMLSQHNKIDVLQKIRAAGFDTMNYSLMSFGADDFAELRAEADRMGYPLAIKSCIGGRGRGAHIAARAERLERAFQHAQTETQIIYGDQRVYLERVIKPAHLIGVQVLADDHGHFVHLGEREGSLQRGNQKMIEESPSPVLTQKQREHMWQTAIEIARLVNFRSAGSIEFFVDGSGQYYFSEIKPRIQMEHPVTEMVSAVDIVREQIRIAAGEPLSITQADVQLRGHAISCRISAEDPWHHFMPGSGRLQRVRLPAGPGVRVDTHVYDGYPMPAQYDPIIARVIVWGIDRDDCVRRIQRALSETSLIGLPTNLPMHQLIVNHPDFIAGNYATDSLQREIPEIVLTERDARDLAVAAAIIYVRRNLTRPSDIPARLLSGWHQSSRRLPE